MFDYGLTFVKEVYSDAFKTKLNLKFKKPITRKICDYWNTLACEFLIKEQFQTAEIPIPSMLKCIHTKMII